MSQCQQLFLLFTRLLSLTIFCIFFIILHFFKNCFDLNTYSVEFFYKAITSQPVFFFPQYKLVSEISVKTEL